jgi:hypothetical protein
MIGFAVDAYKVRQLQSVVGGSEKKLSQQLKIAVNATSKKTVGSMAKQVATELATAQKNIKQTIAITKKAEAGQKIPTAVVTQKTTRRIPLRDFGARQTKSGASYKVSKTKGRKTIAGAFQGPKPGVMKASWRGRVFKRVGKARLPIVQLFGPSPWGVFKNKKLKSPTVKESRKELRRQIDRRLRFLKLKKSGAI